jgi:spore coat polysaccharide biosynthesis protein SpsF
LKTISGKPVLQYILERVQQVVSDEQIIVATSTESSDDPIVEFVGARGIAVYRGSLHKVAERFYGAARALQCTYACRINGDNIFLDTTVLRTMMANAKTGNYRFLSNVKERTFPKGMSVEIVEMGYYEEHLPTILASDYYTEHVMVYLYEDVEAAHYYLMNTALPEAAGLQLALDTQADFDRSKWILEHLGMPHQQAGMREILEQAKQYEQQFKG